MTVPSLLARLDELAAKATPGPWTGDGDLLAAADLDTEPDTPTGDIRVTDPCGSVGWRRAESNIAFIAALVTAWPAIRSLLVAADRLAEVVNVYPKSDINPDQLDLALCDYDAAKANADGGKT